jgi:hypothetical protein
MTTLAIETVNGSPLLLVKGERSEVYRVTPELQEDSFPPSPEWVQENGGWNVILLVGIHMKKNAQ